MAKMGFNDVLERRIGVEPPASVSAVRERYWSELECLNLATMDEYLLIDDITTPEAEKYRGQVAAAEAARALMKTHGNEKVSDVYGEHFSDRLNALVDKALEKDGGLDPFDHGYCLMLRSILSEVQIWQ